MENEKQESNKNMKRRKFLKYTGAGLGLVAGITFLTRNKWRRIIYSLAEKIVQPYQGSTDPSVWFHITPENDIVLYSSKVEMGQGIFTGLAQIAADELDVNVEQIRVEHAVSESGNVDIFATGGSMTIASLWQPLREMAATVRQMITEEAARKWSAHPSEIITKDAMLHWGSQSMTYGDAVSGVTDWKLPDTPKLRSIKDYKFIGKPIARVDLNDKVYGMPIYGIDATIEDLVYASVLRPTKVDAVLASCDKTKALKMPGVIRVVEEDDFIAVIAESYVQATAARRALRAEWKINEIWNLSDVKDKIKVGKGDPTVVQKHGATEDHWGKDGVIEMEFSTPIGAHAQLEPNGALAHYHNGKCTIHMSTQVVNITREEVANRLGISADDVHIVPTFLGGGFGRRLHTPNAVQAAVMSQLIGRPVKCFFDRKQEFQNDTFRPPTHHRMRGKLSSDNRIEAIEHNFASGDVMYGSPLLPTAVQSFVGADIGAIRGGSFMYGGIENRKAVSWRVKLPFATSWWRSLGLLANTFAIESFIDVMAERAGKDPVDFRLEHLTDEKTDQRIANVIKAAAEKANYKNVPEGGRAMGFAASIDANTPCAHVAEISMEGGEIIVHKVTCAMDCGLVINPDQVRAQCEGSIIMGISASLYESMDLKDNVLSPTIYGPYRMAMMKNSPKEIDIVLLQGTDSPGPVGEPPLGPIGAAIANAVYRLTGNRHTSMPLVK